jgi:hypothetical protein
MSGRSDFNILSIHCVTRLAGVTEKLTKVTFAQIEGENENDGFFDIMYSLNVGE